MTEVQETLSLSREAYDAVIFDLDGVVTQSAELHAAAWKKLFDAYLAERSLRDGCAYPPFDAGEDYRRYVDGRPRYDGVATFLASRGIALERGCGSDGPEVETISGLGNRKTDYFLETIERQGVAAYEDARTLLQRLRAAGFRLAVASSSRNCRAVLDAAGLADLFDLRVDGVDLAKRGLPGKPAPDLFLEAARRLGVAPERAVIFEDSAPGVEAGKRGGFGLVIGVDRTGRPAILEEAGADRAERDLSRIAVAESGKDHAGPLPSALDRFEEIAARIGGRPIALFLDYDGTLTPIVARPDLAVLSEDMRAVLAEAAERATVIVMSGRDVSDIEARVGVAGIVYAGSHGFDIDRHGTGAVRHEKGQAYLADLERAASLLEEKLSGIEGVLLDRKHYAVAVHYRLARDADLPKIRAIVASVRDLVPRLRVTHGKKIFELQPDIEWDKGRAALWLLETLDLARADAVPIFIGDDETDEDAFRALRAQAGISIVVQDHPRPSAASYRLEGADAVRAFLARLIAHRADGQT